MCALDLGNVQKAGRAADEGTAWEEELGDGLHATCLIDIMQTPQTAGSTDVAGDQFRL